MPLHSPENIPSFSKKIFQSFSTIQDAFSGFIKKITQSQEYSPTDSEYLQEKEDTPRITLEKELARAKTLPFDGENIREIWQTWASKEEIASGLEIDSWIFSEKGIEIPNGELDFLWGSTSTVRILPPLGEEFINLKKIEIDGSHRFDEDFDKDSNIRKALRKRGIIIKTYRSNSSSTTNHTKNANHDTRKNSDDDTSPSFSSIFGENDD